jgi:hypothetical protein
MLPQISPSPLTSVKEPIGHPNWVYELMHDGFRGVLYVDREQAWLVSRKGKTFRQFEPLLKQVLRSLKGQRAILDGEIVVLDEKGRSNFFDLMAHRGEPRYYAFDLMWLNGIDLRSRPLLERKSAYTSWFHAPTLICCTWITSMVTECDSLSWCVGRTWKESSASPILARTRLLGSKSRIPITRRLRDARNGLIGCCPNDNTSFLTAFPQLP